MTNFPEGFCQNLRIYSLLHTLTNLPKHPAFEVHMIVQNENKQIDSKIEDELYPSYPSSPANSYKYSKTCVKWPLSKMLKISFQDQSSLKQVESIAECSKGSILQYFRPSLSYHVSLRSLFCRFRVAVLYRFTITDLSTVSNSNATFSYYHSFDILMYLLKLIFEIWRLKDDIMF